MLEKIFQFPKEKLSKIYKSLEIKEDVISMLKKTSGKTFAIGTWETFIYSLHQLNSESTSKPSYALYLKTNLSSSTVLSTCGQRKG